VSCKKNETKIFGPDPTGPAGPGPTNRFGLVRFGSIPTDPPSPLSLLGSSPHMHALLSAPLVAAAPPTSSGCARPSPSPVRWFTSPPQSDLRPCPDRFDPRGLPCSPSTSEILVAAGQFGRRRCSPGRPALAMPCLNPPSSFLYTAAP
jgi:hypothetical protein